MFIALANSKGGVGKSTLSVHLAAWLHERKHSVALIDADPQGASSKWFSELEPSLPIYRLRTPDDIIEQAPTLREQTEYLIADGPAGLSEATRALFLVCDLALVPCGPSVLDLRASEATLRVLKQAQAVRKGSPQAFLVPNKLQTHYRLTQELLDTLQGMSIPATPGLKLRQSYADSVGQGSVVWRMGAPAREAAEEMAVFCEHLYNLKPSIQP